MTEDEKILQQHLHLINNSFYGRTNIDTFKQNKKLLLADLCARLPYGVIVQYKGRNTIIKNKVLTGSDLDCNMDYYKPYLRPMSSMTEEEVKEIAILHGIKDILSIKVTSDYIDVIVDDGFCSTETRTIWYDEIILSIEIFDWLNEHHFDYRGLIEKGLAIPVTKENNPYI